MHFIFISSLVPVAAPASGYDIANRVIVDAIRLLGHKVSVLGFLQPSHEPANENESLVLGRLEVTNARVGALQKAMWLKESFLRGEPVSVAKMHTVSETRIRAALDRFAPFDALVLNSVQLPGAFYDLFAAWPHVFVAHNVEARSAYDNAANADNLVTRLLFARDARLLARLEHRLCAGAGHVFTLAEADRADLGVGHDGHSTALPLVTSVATPEGGVDRTPVYDAGLIGSWSWAANRSGLDWFASEIVPRLPPDFSIAIAGGIGADRPAVPDNVVFLGRVPDARDFVRSCRIIPLVSRTGTGVQLKTIETFEMGLPSVATGNALRGILSPPDNCVSAEDPAEFAAAMVDLVTRSRAGEALDRDGRAFHSGQLEGLMQGLAAGLENVKNMVNKP